MEKSFVIKENDKYALIPVYDNSEKVELNCYKDDQMIWSVKIAKPLAGKDCLFKGAMPLFKADLDDECITIRGDVDEAFLEAIELSSKEEEPASLHPAIHFTASNGWINDPNGLVYRDGIYHMYFQYNPVDIQWENMCWGHAVSKDLINWEQLEPVLYPDQYGTIFSGSGLLNKNAKLGLPEDAMIFYYTAAGNFNPLSKGVHFTQRIAYSLDGGKSLIKCDATAVEYIKGENRDPKVYYYPDKDLYYMALYLDGDEFAILTSKDMATFTETDRVYMPGSGECPDLREIADEEGNKHFIFSQADGSYYIGDFDGERFIKTSELKYMYGNDMPYAAQTFSDVEDRVIQVAFLRAACKGATYTNIMSLPRELSFVRVDGRLEIAMKPVREYFQARKEAADWSYQVGKGVAKELVVELGGLSKVTNDESVASDKSVASDDELVSDQEITIKLGQTNFTFKNNQLQVNDRYFTAELDAKELHILIDKEVMEVSTESYIKPCYFELEPSEIEGVISVDGAEAKLYEIS